MLYVIWCIIWRWRPTFIRLSFHRDSSPKYRSSLQLGVISVDVHLLPKSYMSYDVDARNCDERRPSARPIRSAPQRRTRKGVRVCRPSWERSSDMEVGISLGSVYDLSGPPNKALWDINMVMIIISLLLLLLLIVVQITIMIITMAMIITMIICRHPEAECGASSQGLIQDGTQGHGTGRSNVGDC